MADHGIFEVDRLPAAPVDAAMHFHQHVVPQLRQRMAGDVTVLLPRADHAHGSWRRAVIQELAREAAPRRVNAVAGSRDADVDAVIAYLESAPGVTGQVFEVHGNRAQVD